MAEIYDAAGNTITEGLQGCKSCNEAMQMAKVWADKVGASVTLSDDDGEWLVHPKRGDGSRELATSLGVDQENCAVLYVGGDEEDSFVHCDEALAAFAALDDPATAHIEVREHGDVVGHFWSLTGGFSPINT